MDFNPDTLPYADAQTERRVALVTGGNSGIGWFTVLHLYLHGYVVYIAGRSKTRVTKAITEIKNEALLRRSRYSKDETTSRVLGEMTFIEVDLVDLASVESCAEQFKTLELELHLLVNNAGIMAAPFSLTKDGFEIQMQTNYVSPFVLTQRLIPVMEHASDPRIVYLSSIGHLFAFWYFDMDTTFDYHPNIVFTWFRYGMAKMAGIHYTKMLALKHPRILCTAVHPGFVMSTNLFSYWTRLPIIGTLFWIMFQIFGWLFGVTNEEGSYATLKVALSKLLTANKDNGKYFAAGGVESKPSAVASNMDYAARTWIWTIHELRDRRVEVAER
ncbi:hypothetical protein BABINDRAFT_29888 [Babjeviella inositovora NRRL Y-12698]|uniref:NAD(P)-binding protein n=1 Tax=Babjeviella inositovora NRRL Y-12698 TaxID=984486 RepID=A0A1E3QY04_9ASCO|nr:uncharacterized protein BABINDRAFT_29888 [Babjeviella inositovora NRRL Y-12698]ODQ82526.1 hypothetical protein BABINDRAFT_29888 [Babjeviella inositovora NRRL Y-12698]